MSKLPIFNLEYEKEDGEILNFDGSFLFHTYPIGQLKRMVEEKNASTSIFNDMFSIKDRLKNINIYNDILRGKGTFINFYDNLGSFLPKIENNFQEYKEKLIEINSIDRKVEDLNTDIENVRKGNIQVFQPSENGNTMYFHDYFPNSFYSEGYISYDDLKNNMSDLNSSHNIPLNNNVDLPFVYGTDQIDFSVSFKSLIEDIKDFKENLEDGVDLSKSDIEVWLEDWWENELSEWPEDSFDEINFENEFSDFIIDFILEDSAFSNLDKLENFIEGWNAKQNLHCFMVNFNSIIAFAKKKKEEIIEEIEENKERLFELKLEKLEQEWEHQDKIGLSF